MAIKTQYQSVLATMSDTLFNGDSSLARNHFHLCLLMHAAFYLERATLAENSTWGEDARYGALVDALTQ
jgi:hypothetical protein